MVIFPKQRQLMLTYCDDDMACNHISDRSGFPMFSAPSGARFCRSPPSVRSPATLDGCSHRPFLKVCDVVASAIRVRISMWLSKVELCAIISPPVAARCFASLLRYCYNMILAVCVVERCFDVASVARSSCITTWIDLFWKFPARSTYRDAIVILLTYTTWFDL